MTDQQILDNAPDGATHVDSDGDYWLMTEESWSMAFLLGEWISCEPQGHIRSLSDIKRIAELEKIIELLFNCCYEIDDHSQREYNTNYIKALALKEKG